MSLVSTSMRYRVQLRLWLSTHLCYLNLNLGLGQFNGGYFTEWFRHHSPMCGLRFIQKEHRNWIIETLDSDVSLLYAQL